jgi:hypothetical protein
MDTPIGYCALVDGRNSFGGYVGFKKFFAAITRNARKEYHDGSIKYIAGAPITPLWGQHFGSGRSPLNVLGSTGCALRPLSAASQVI